MNYYDLLGVSQDASGEEIREAYFESARRYHPDVHSSPDANTRFALIQQAYEILQDPRKRDQYDHKVNETKSPIQVKVHYSADNIRKLAEEQLVYSLVEVNCLAKKENSQPPPIHVCLVLDCSTSMKGERLDLVKTNVIHLLKRLRVQDILSVVTFNDRAEKLIIDARGSEHKTAEERISLLMASGGTEIYKGLEAGMSLLRQTKGRATRLLVLITDGHTYGDDQACVELAKQARNEDVVIHAAGIGGEWNDILLDQLTAITGGASEFITRSKDLFQFFEKQIDALGLLFARNLRLSGSSDPGVELRAVCRISPDAMIVPFEYPLSLGPLLAGRTSSILFEFLVHPTERHHKSVVLIEGDLQADLVVPTTDEETRHLVIKRPNNAELAGEFTPSSALIDAVSKFNLYRLQERAREELVSGKIDLATRHLQHIATHLFSQGNPQAASMVMEEIRTIQKQQGFSEEGEKRVKYGTRALLLPSGDGEER